MNKLFKNYIYNIAYQMFVVVVPLILSPYLARVLGAQELGKYSYVYSVASIMSTVILIGTYSYGTRQIAYVRNDRNELKKTYWELFWLRLLLGIIGTIIYLAISLFSSYKIYFILYYAWLLASFIDPSWLFVGVEDMKPTVIKNFFIKLASVILTFIFVKNSSDLWKYVIIMSTSTLVANFMLLFQTSKYVGKALFTMTNASKHIKGSFYLFLPQVATTFYLQIDKVMINFLTGTTSQVSFYDQAEKIVTIPLTCITVMSTVIMPRIANNYAKGDKKRIEDMLVMVANFSLMLAIPMCFGIAGIAKCMVPWYLGREFLPTIYAIIIISPIVITNSLSGISGNQYFTATNQINILLKAYFSAAIINIIVNAILIPLFGFYGAAIATVLSSLVSVFIQYKELGKQINIEPFKKSGINYLIKTIPMIIVVTLTGILMKANAVTTLIQIILGTITYFSTLILTKDTMLLYVFRNIFKRKKI